MLLISKLSGEYNICKTRIECFNEYFILKKYILKITKH